MKLLVTDHELQYCGIDFVVLIIRIILSVRMGKICHGESYYVHLASDVILFTADR